MNVCDEIDLGIDLRRTVLYPFTSEDMVLYKYFSKYNKKYNITKVVSHQSSGLIGKDVSYTDRRNPVNDIIDANIREVLEKVDCLLVSSGNEKDLKHHETIEIIKYALELKKEVICCAKIGHKNIEILRKTAIENNVKIPTFYDINSDVLEIPDEIQRVKKIECPVVLVGKLISQSCDECELIAGLNISLSTAGHRVSVVTNNDIMKALGFRNSLSNIFSLPIAPKYIIEKINLFFQKISMDERPEIILVEAPDSLLRFSERIPDGYGIDTYMLCQAVQPEYCIGCFYASANNAELSEYIRTDMLVRLGVELIAIHLCGVTLDGSKMRSTDNVETYRIGISEIENQINVYNNLARIPIINAREESGINILSKIIINATIT